MSDGDIGSALSPVQQALSSKMQGDDTLMGMVAGVFDFRGIPENQTYPYVTVGDSTETDDSTFDTTGYDTTFTLHIWSIQPGTQECQRILARLNKLFNHQPLTVPGMAHVGTWYDLSNTLADPDDTRVTHFWVRYRIGVGEIGDD